MQAALEKASEQAAADQAIGREPTDALEFMERVMMDPANPLNIRLEAAKHLAPFKHPRLSSAEVTMNNHEPEDVETLNAKLSMLLGRMNPELLSGVLWSAMATNPGLKDLIRKVAQKENAG